ncbi:ABC transporter permease [Dactylosporangium sp. CA-233914]|uniref:ABC transporter permease n=1 Tax=Dactylosporangium sp. CA-233914 TaxID=3239934 RepID=UPI003D8E36E1
MGALRAEWTKLRTVAGTWWLLAAAVAGTVGLGALMTVTLERRDRAAADLVQLGLYGVRAGQVAVAVLAVLSVTNEYGTGMIRACAAAVPRRALGLLAKLAVLAATVLAVAVLAVAGSLLAARQGLAGEPARRAAAGSVLYLVLVALLAAGIAVVVRDTGAAIATVLAVLFAGPLLATMAAGPRWQHRLHRFGPMDAGLAVQVTKPIRPPDIGPWAGLGVLALYAAAAVLLALLLVERRDV